MAMEGANPTLFRYGLQALLRKRTSELDLAREELAAANEQFETQARALEVQEAKVTQLEAYQRDLSKDGASIDVEGRMRLHQCLRSAVLQKEQHAVQLENARQHQENAVRQVRAARQALKAIERHREHSVGQFNLEQTRKALLASDELHLSTLRSKANAATAATLTEGD
jgi:flagellar biosynthesis chaperone FliJ